MFNFKFTTVLLILSLIIVGCATGAPDSTTPFPTMSAPATPAGPMQAPTLVAPIPPSPTAASTAPVGEPTTVVLNPTVTLTPTVAAGLDPNADFKWTQLDAPVSPPARYDHALALDSENRQLVLFGGRADGQVMGDTWIYDLANNQWREIKSPGPSPRFGFASVYDPSSRAVYLFGGQQQDFYNDTWKFDTVSETWSVIATTGAKPDIRYGHGVTLDNQKNRLVISHGFPRDGRHDDTWALDLATNTWTELTPSGDKPLKRCLHDIAYAPQSNTVYLFGGCSSGFGPCPQGDLWALDLNTNQWTMASPAGNIPSARENPSIVVDPATGKIILFGGRAEGNVNDLWMFDPGIRTWAQINAEGPAPRKSHDAVFDAANNRMYLFGGTTGDGAANDLWVLEHN